MAVVSVYHVGYHFEVGGRKATEDYTDYVQAADNSYNSLKTVLITNNSKQRGPGTLVVDFAKNIGPAGQLA